MRRHFTRGLLGLLTLLIVATSASPAFSVTKKEVDEACADSKDARAAYEAAQASFAQAVDEYQHITADLEETSLKVSTLRSIADEHERTITAMRDRVVERAVELYMSGGPTTTQVFFIASSVDQVVAGREFLEAIAQEDLGSIDRLVTLKRELERTREDLTVLQQAQREDQATADALTVRLEESRNEADSVRRDLSATCNELLTKYRAEIAARLAAEAARRGGASGGISADATPGFICPMDAGASSFINDWGFRRSGGRTHKGTDVFARMGQPVYAVANGTVRIGNGGLGGMSVWLNSNYGTSFYYAHLSAWGPSIGTGSTVTTGQIVGYNGDSGNARGGSPHVHFQIHPGGGSPVNPYPTLKRACG